MDIAQPAPVSAPPSPATTSPIAVALLSASLSRNAGGITPIMQNHAIGLRALGLSVEAFGVEDEWTEADRPGWEDVPLQARPASLGSFHFAPGLNQDVREFAPDLVHQHGIWSYPSLVASRWRRRTRRPLVVSTQGMLEPWAIRHSRAKKQLAGRLFEHRNLREAACIHVSPAEVEGVRAFGLTNPVAVIANGVGLPDPSVTHARPGWMDDRKTLLFLGRVHPKKGLIETIRAWSRLHRDAPDLSARWRLAIAGWDDGGHQAKLDALAAELEMGDSVVMLGPLFGEAKHALLQHADAFILASHSEGLPMAVLEAWANRLPVFMTPACNLPDGFAAGAAIEIDTDPSRLAAALATHLARADLADVGTRGVELAQRDYSWTHVVQQLHDVYRWLVRGAPRPACVQTI